ncbi:cytochrome P450 [Clohesyomyces aquaticus]|uniref:Cytochrome P450 n=1 Tax=Clohesyomyces aquaticus TaxID=1231657 RepID=A0A1Y1ZXV2_9PLEO|nr:cytochrome P450 [Clohesyomyces aquaticus]
MGLAKLLVKLFGVALAVLIMRYVVSYLRSSLKGLPGPFLAKFSDVWRFWNHYTWKHIETQKKLHEQYGDVVQLGPKTVSLSDPNLLKTIYTTRGTFIKICALGSPFIAQELDPLMNDTDASKGKTCDIADWISFLITLDFLGDMTFSKRFGFMEQAQDINGQINTAERVMHYFSVVGQIPMLDKWLGKNLWCPIKFADFAIPAGFCIQRFMKRVQNLEQFKDKKDFMNGFLEAKKEFPDLVSDNTVIGYMIINILGGVDTTAIVMKAIFYWILKNPSIKAKLVDELRTARLPFPANYTSAEQLPYLDACIKDGLRFHPVVGHILERVVPSTGLRLSYGTTLPPGTIVGINPWVLSRNKNVYGEDAEDFIPERWFRKENEDKEAYEVRFKMMKDADMAFGNGNRACLGRLLALVELHKVTATIFSKYKIELEDPE